MAWRSAVFLFGIMALLIAYYVIHKPLLPAPSDAPFTFDLPALLQRSAAALFDVLNVLLLFVISGGIGRALLHLAARSEVRMKAQTSEERLAIQALVGLGVLGTLAMGIALAGVLTSLTVWLLLAACLLLTFRSALAWLRAALADLRGLRAKGGFARFCALLSGFLILTALLIAIAPPWSWDAMVYHLVGPQQYLTDGRMTADPINFYLGMPKNGDMLFTLVMAQTGSDHAPAVVHLGFMLLALVITAALARRAANANAGWLAVVLLLGSYNLWELAGWAYVDWAVMAYGIAIFSLLAHWDETRAGGLLVLVGVLLGIAIGYKLTSAYIAVGVGVFLLVRAPRQVIANGLRVGLPALLCAAPWLLRGWALYGNPVYPLLGFGLNWDGQRSAAFTRAGYGMVASGDAWQLLFMPFTATIFGINQGPNTSFTHGPFLLTLPFLLPLCWRWLADNARRLALNLVIMIVPLYGLWVYLAATSGTGAQSRLAVPLLALSAVLGGLALYGVSKMPRKPLNLAFLLNVVLALTLLLGTVDVVTRIVDTDALRWLAGGQARADYLRHNLGVWYDAMERLEDMPAGTTVRMLWDLRTYYCPSHITCTPDTMLDAYSLAIRRGETPDAIFEAWRATGDEYVLLYRLGYDHFTNNDLFYREENLGFPAALERHMTPVWDIMTLDGAAYTLFEWKAGS
jgi:hypothetical protein